MKGKYTVFSFIPLFVPLFYMAQRFGDHLYLSQIVLHLRESIFFFSVASLDAKRQYLNTSSLQSLELNPFGLRLSSIWSHSCIVSRAFTDSIKSRDRYPYLAYCSSETIPCSTPSGQARCWFTEVANLL